MKFTITGNTDSGNNQYHSFTIGSTVKLADSVSILGQKLYHAGGAVLQVIHDKDLEAVVGITAVEAVEDVVETVKQVKPAKTSKGV